jgi:hypothetical protein
MAESVLSCHAFKPIASILSPKLLITSATSLEKHGMDADFYLNEFETKANVNLI